MTTIFFLLSLIPAPTTTQGSHYYDRVNPALGNVTHCMYGKMTLQDNGILVGANGQTEDFHQLMADVTIDGIPEQAPIDANITVCQNGGRLVYSY
jgi:hypothetical protein